MSKTILITGCAGMIGSNLAHHLLNTTDYKVVGIDNLSGGYLDNFPDTSERCNFLSFDILDPDMMQATFEVCKPNIVYHCAAYAAEGLSPFIRRFNYTNNVVGTAGVVNACIEHSVDRLVFFSSIAVYGTSATPFRELTTVPSPIDPYGIAKYACEMDIVVASEQHDLDYVIVRPFNVYGERQNLWDRYRNVLGIWMYNYMNDLPLQIYGDGTQIRSFTYIRDILPGLVRLGIDPLYGASIINIGSDIPYSLNQAMNKFIEVVGLPLPEIQYLPERHEAHEATADVSAFNNLAGPDFVPTTLSEGLKKMWAWAQQQPKRERKSWDSYEITKGIYENWKT